MKILYEDKNLTDLKKNDAMARIELTVTTFIMINLLCICICCMSYQYKYIIFGHDTKFIIFLTPKNYLTKIASF